MWRGLILGAGLGSAALLIGAFAFQHLGGLAPCKMCLWQRWPHGVAALLGVGGALLALRSIWLPILGALAAAATAGIGIYHTGVERGWWEGPTSCTSGSIEGLSTAELMEQILAAPVVQCDQVAWEMAGLSMASWNALFSLILVGLWLAAAQKINT